MAGHGRRVRGEPAQPSGPGLPRRPGGDDEAAALRHGGSGRLVGVGR